MAIRNIRVIGDDILRKKCKEVKEITEKNKELIQDMLDTMYDADGVGLAAPQVGILKRIAVIDVSETRDQPIVLINPVVKDAKGEQTDMEGCLSVPEKAGQVTRPMKVKVETYDMDMKRGRFVVDAKSILGIMNLGLNNVISLQVYGDHCEELKK